MSPCTLYITENDLELLTPDFHFLNGRFSGLSHHCYHIYVVLGVGPRASGMLAKHSTN